VIGKNLGHYLVGEQLGRGGMGEVYAADDLNLNRKVALKFLPDAFSGDPERMARFEREARLLASLNHPNIAAIYGLEQAEGKRFIVMELVEGETLAQRIGKGALPIGDALAICRQIAEGLEAAHDRGVIHRDLKPANVMITDGDKVKILDFGLAKALSDETQSIDSSQSPTLTEAMTRPGVILGTAAYMSPEQAKGKSVDKRADIWAFGCILYECLTGKRAFEGETVTETLAAVLTKEPEWQVLPASTPANIRFVLRRCLVNDTSERFHHAADLRILMEGAPEIGDAVVPVKHSLKCLAWGVATVLLLALSLLSFLYFRQKTPEPAGAAQFQVPLPDKTNMATGAAFAVSPDGRRLAFAAADADGKQRIWLRSLDSLEARPLLGTESGYIGIMFWSPDGRFIAYDAGAKLIKIDLSGSPPQTLCDNLGSLLTGGSWNRDGLIIFGLTGQGLMRVSAAGGAPSPLAIPQKAGHKVSACFPIFLPDGRHFIYYNMSPTPENEGGFISSLDAKEQDFRKILSTNRAPILYAPSQNSGPGWLLFVREQTLMAQPFDDKRQELSGDSIPLANQIGLMHFLAYFSASTNGVIVYRAGSGTQFNQAAWFDRKGNILSSTGDPGLLMDPALSPDGALVAVGYGNDDLQSMDLWLLDSVKGTNTRFTFGKGMNRSPIWSSDGSGIIFASKIKSDGGVFDLYQKLASGAKEEELLLKTSENKTPTSWSRDGRFLLYSVEDPKTKSDLWVLPTEGNAGPLCLLRTEFNEGDGRFSPDMRWIAYQSDESGRSEVYVRMFQQASGGASLGAGEKWLVSREGGSAPRWRGDGRELCYRDSNGRVMSVEIMAGKTFKAGIPKPLFQPSPSIQSAFGYDVSADGRRFLMMAAASTEKTSSPFTVILNWTSLLNK